MGKNVKNTIISILIMVITAGSGTITVSTHKSLATINANIDSVAFNQGVDIGSNV